MTYVVVVSFRRATVTRLSGWVGRQPGGNIISDSPQPVCQFVYFRGVSGSRLSGWGGRQPGCNISISPQPVR